MDSPDSGGNQDKKRLACPSGPCHEGGSVIGVMTEQGRLAYLPMPVVMDAAFVAGLQEAGYPERRYRFSRPCVESACSPWTGRGCAVVDHVLDEPSDGGCAGHRPPAEPGGSRPTCGIRRDCRWFAQRGSAACLICPTLVAEPAERPDTETRRTPARHTR